MRLYPHLGQLAKRDVVEHYPFNLLGEGEVTTTLLIRKVWKSTAENVIAAVSQVSVHQSLISHVGEAVPIRSSLVFPRGSYFEGLVRGP